MRAIWILVVGTVLLASLAAPMADAGTRRHVHDENVIFVGAPTVAGIWLAVGDPEPGRDAAVATARSYTFTLEPSDDWVEIELKYKPGPTVGPRDCTRPVDLDMTLHGPDGVVRALDGCDTGKLVIAERDLAPGDYAVEVESGHGANVCLPYYHIPLEETRRKGCRSPDVSYVFDLWIRN